MSFNLPARSSRPRPRRPRAERRTSDLPFAALVATSDKRQATTDEGAHAPAAAGAPRFVRAAVVATSDTQRRHSALRSVFAAVLATSDRRVPGARCRLSLRARQKQVAVSPSLGVLAGTSAPGGQCAAGGWGVAAGRSCVVACRYERGKNKVTVTRRLGCAGPWPAGAWRGSGAARAGLRSAVSAAWRGVAWRCTVPAGTVHRRGVQPCRSKQRRRGGDP